MVNKKKTKNRKVRIHSEAILISSKENLSYAAVLKIVNSDSDLRDLGRNLNQIRRTQKGRLMFELKSSMGQTDGFRKQVINFLGGNPV